MKLSLSSPQTGGRSVRTVAGKRRMVINELWQGIEYGRCALTGAQTRGQQDKDTAPARGCQPAESGT
jgi:hypothetical protein